MYPYKYMLDLMFGTQTQCFEFPCTVFLCYTIYYAHFVVRIDSIILGKVDVTLSCATIRWEWLHLRLLPFCVTFRSGLNEDLSNFQRHSFASSELTN